MRTSATLLAGVIAAALAVGGCSSQLPTPQVTATATVSAWEVVRQRYFTTLPTNVAGDATVIGNYAMVTARDELEAIFDDPASFNHQGFVFRLFLVEKLGSQPYTAIALPTAMYGSPSDEAESRTITLWADPALLSGIVANSEVAVAGVVVTGSELGTHDPFVLHGMAILPLADHLAATSVGTPRQAVTGVTDTLTVGTEPVAVGLYGESLYVANSGDATVSVVSTVSHRVTSVVPVGAAPTAVLLDEVDGVAYIVNSGDNTVSVLDAGTDQVTATIAVGASPRAAAGNSSTGLYVANRDDGTVSVVDTDTKEVLGTVAVRPGPTAVALSGTTLLVTSSDRGTLTLVDTTTDTVASTIAVGGSPAGVAVDTRTGEIWVSNAADGTVSLVDAGSRSVVATIAVGADPAGLAVDPAAGALYVANRGDGTVSVVQTASRTVAATIRVRPGPSGVVVAAATGAVYVTNAGDGTVSVLRAR